MATAARTCHISTATPPVQPLQKHITINLKNALKSLIDATEANRAQNKCDKFQWNFAHIFHAANVGFVYFTNLWKWENGKMAKSEKHSETLTKIIYLLLLFAPNSCRGNGKFQFKNFLCGLWSWSPEQLIKVCTRWNVPPTTRLTVGFVPRPMSNSQRAQLQYCGAAYT